MSEIVELEEDQNIQQEALLISLKNDNFDEFKAILKQGICAKTIDINHVHKDSENETLLDIACSNTNRAPYVQLLLESGADVNRLNPSLGAAPIHLAIYSSDFDTVQFLLEHKDTDIYQENTTGKTAFQLAAERKKKNFIQLLQKRQAADIKLTKRKILNNTDNPYDHIQDILQLPNPFLPPKISDSYNDTLFPFLLQANYEAFASEANEYNVKLEDSNLPFTYLQLACKLGLTKFVQLLLDLNVDPNETVKLHQRTPITIAAFQGYYNIVQLLQDTGIIRYDLIFNENVLHSVLEGFNRWEKYQRRHQLGGGDHRDHLKCLKLILHNVPDKQLDIDLKGSYGFTPLNYAIYSDHREMILLLLERGAYLGAPGWLNKPVVQYMIPATLEYLLERSISHIWTISASRCLLKFNYNLLTCSYQYSKHGYIDETKPLLAISEVPELKPLLKHPLFLVFLDFKWHVIMRKVYYINLAFHFQYVLFLSMYLLAFNYATSNDEIVASTYATTFWYIIFISNSIMFLRECAQFIIYSKANKYRYVIDPKNWMKVNMTLITYAILFGQVQSIQIRAFLAATAIFHSYVELILLFLSHPRMCVRIEMFKAVAMNSLKFLMSYVILILAFAFSFYILFKNANSTNKSFEDISQAIFKTLLMSTGEYELSEVRINDEYGISRLVIILFIFLIPTVLLNLLNAIAVSDIQGIRTDAQLVSVVARIKLIIHMEEIICTLYSCRGKLANYYATLVGRQQTQECDYAQIRYSLTKYFGTTSNGKDIIYNPLDNQCTIDEPHVYGYLKFSVSPFTLKAIGERLSAKVGQEEKEDTCNAKVAQEAATLQEICKNQEALKDTLEKLENRFQMLEQKLTGST